MAREKAEDDRAFEEFFYDATGFSPYEWQIQVATETEELPEILPVPTGLGKTEGVALAWAWRRIVERSNEPLHLVYCLPMRSLVRQTVDRLRAYFEALRSKRKVGVDVYQLMGGTIENEWARWPDRPWVLVGTQDQLLSRALNRGYAMSRFEWPVHFGLLNQDCRWIIDEVQLMGPGLWTTAQLDWMRRKRFRSLKSCRTTWMSATLGDGFLATADRKRDNLDIPTPFVPRLDADPKIQWWRDAKRPLEWLELGVNSSLSLAQKIALDVSQKHEPGTLSLIVCNTVDLAQKIFRNLSNNHRKILLTSRFRRQDREYHENALLQFEATRRTCQGKPVPDHPGLICVSTQVVEAGIDVSAHHLWSELAPWPSVIQRLGRLNRDGHDLTAHAWFWETRVEGRIKPQKLGPYNADDIRRAKTLVDALRPLTSQKAFHEALDDLQKKCKGDLAAALRPKPAPMPRALDVHGLFSTEPDVHGGFTDVSAFVRGVDQDADLIVFWREWPGVIPPQGEDLDGPALNVQNEGCPISLYRLQETLKATHSQGWIWNDEANRWEKIRSEDLRPGMVVMLQRETGGYDTREGWTGEKRHFLNAVSTAGPGRALRDDERTETGYWATLDAHLSDARREAELLCDAVALRNDIRELRPLRTAVIEAAALHDLGKAHPRWQQALPAAAGLVGGPWAKCPRVLAVDVKANIGEVQTSVLQLRPEAVALEPENHKHRSEEVLRLRWAVGERLQRKELDFVRSLTGVRWAGHERFLPGLRHEAASALTMWRHYCDGGAPYPALAVYLAAAHHGKVRTVLRSITDEGEDVFGIPTTSEALMLSGEQWPFDFSVAKDGAEGRWGNGKFLVTGYGWTGLVADLLGPWRADDQTKAGVIPEEEPSRRGPFVLAYLEALVRVADWRASEKPSQCTKPGEIRRDT